MELVLLIGIPATGKSSFARDRLFDSHLRINRDMLRTANRERRLFETALATGTAVVVDNTNVTRAERATFITPARAARFVVRGFFFESRLAEALARNERRLRSIPPAGVRGRAALLELPRPSEGFDSLSFVRLSGAGGFDVSEWDETR